MRRLPDLLRLRRFQRVLPHRLAAARSSSRGRRAGGRRGAERCAKKQGRAARDVQREGRHGVDAGGVHGHAARHLPTRHHRRRRGQAGRRRSVSRPDAAREVPVALLDAALHPMILGYLGAGALLAALVMGGFSALLSFWAGWRDTDVFIQVGRRAFYAAAAMTAIAAVLLEVALVTHDFSLAYVVEHTDLSTPIPLVAAGFYGGQEGSLLYWTLILGVLGSASLFASARIGARVAAYAAGILALILSFFLFDLLSITPPDGLGLNPVLRDGGMLIHPPVVLAGFASFAIPFAFACAALLAGRADAAWIRHTRRFALLAWSLQSAGLLLGMWWAYHVLGWGGYWSWDPVENVALMPWLATTAYLHSSQVQETRGRLRTWNFGLVILAFLLVVFGTFIVRSGVVPSVHTFAISAIGPWFLGFLGFCIAFSGVLLTARSGSLGAATTRPAAAISREGAFVLQNVLLIGVIAVVFWGTVLPLVSGMFGLERVVGAPYYERARAGRE